MKVTTEGRGDASPDRREHDVMVELLMKENREMAANIHRTLMAELTHDFGELFMIVDGDEEKTSAMSHRVGEIMKVIGNVCERFKK